MDTVAILKAWELRTLFMLLHFPQIHTNKHLTWIENVDFGKFFLTGLEELLFKRGKTPFYRVFICVCKTKRGKKKVETEEYRNIFLNGSRGNISWEEKKYHFVTWRKSNRVQQEGIIDCKRNYSKTKGENPTEAVLPIDPSSHHHSTPSTYSCTSHVLHSHFPAWVTAPAGPPWVKTAPYRLTNTKASPTLQSGTGGRINHAPSPCACPRPSW